MRGVSGFLIIAFLSSVWAGCAKTTVVTDLRGRKVSISRISPRGGLPAGGNELTLTGFNLDFVRSVFLGDNPCNPLTIVSSQKANCIVPPSSSVGPVDLVARTLKGTITLVHDYHYSPNAYIDSVSSSFCNIFSDPDHCQSISIIATSLGETFVEGATATLIGPLEYECTTSLNSSPSFLLEIHCTIPTDAEEGPYFLSVTNPDTDSSNLQIFYISTKYTADLVDQNGSEEGFGGGAFSGTLWSPEYSAVTLDETSDTSRNLPDGGSTSDWLSMVENVALLHLDEPTGATSFVDSSPLGLAYSCKKLFNQSCPVSGEVGKLGNAALFGYGTSQSIVAAELPTTQANSVTLSVWANPSASHNFGSILAYLGATGHSGYGLLLTDGKVTILHGGKTTNVTNSNYILPLNTWTMVTAVGDASNNWSLYINGLLNSTANRIPNPPYVGNENSFYIGNNNDLNQSFDGLLDEVSLWTRPLTPSEIQRMYQYQSPKYFGVFTSRVMDGLAPINWESLIWTPNRPTDKNLPNQAQIERAYPAGNVNMSQNTLLLHMDESAWDSVGDVIDSSPSGNNGTSTDATSTPFGRLNNGGSFNGTSSYISVPGLPATETDPFSIEAWVRTAVQGSKQMILTFGPAGSSAVTFYVNTSGRLETDLNSVTGPISATNITDGQWHHVAVVNNQGELLNYVDGKPSGPTTAMNPNIQGSNQMNSNAYGGTKVGVSLANDGYFNGIIDEVAVYTRALSSSEIYDRYLRGAVSMKFQVRSCSLNDCSDSVFLGPGMAATNYFSELTNTLLNLPQVSLSETLPGSHRYFQYRTTMQSDTVTYIPQLGYVSVVPGIN